MRSSNWLRNALCTRGTPLGVPLSRAVVLSSGTINPSSSAPVCPFDPSSLVMLVMPEKMQHSCRYLFTGSETSQVFDTQVDMLPTGG